MCRLIERFVIFIFEKREIHVKNTFRLYNHFQLMASRHFTDQYGLKIAFINTLKITRINIPKFLFDLFFLKKIEIQMYNS